MGYQSEVCIRVLTKHQNELLAKIKEADFHLWDNSEYYSDEHYFTVFINDVKWYNGYPSVDIINSYIESLDDEGGIICIGEDGESWSYGEPNTLEVFTNTAFDVDIPFKTADRTSLYDAAQKCCPEYFL